MAYERLETASCIATITESGENMSNMITKIQGPTNAKPGENCQFELFYKNLSGQDNSFALMFCASEAPHSSCNVKDYLSEAFIINASTSGKKFVNFQMPATPIAYAAELQMWQNDQWVTVGKKTGTVDTGTSSSLMMIGLFVLAAAAIMLK